MLVPQGLSSGPFLFCQKRFLGSLSCGGKGGESIYLLFFTYFCILPPYYEDILEKYRIVMGRKQPKGLRVGGWDTCKMNEIHSRLVHIFPHISRDVTTTGNKKNKLKISSPLQCILF